jgi:hypothetical protein
MTAYSHRDRRVHRTIARSLATVSALVAALATLSIFSPDSVVGVTGIVALAILGAAYLYWSERVVAEYARDLRAIRDGSTDDGFLRVEMGSAIALDRAVGRPTERSPHVRLPRSAEPSGDGGGDETPR